MDESQRDLWERFIRNECTTSEIEQLLEQFNDAANESELRELISAALQDEVTRIEPALPDLEQKETEIYAALLPNIREQRKPYLWPRIAAAASVILIISAGGYFLWHKKPQKSQIAQNQHDVAPGTDKAIIKMANGKQINVTDAKNGLLARQGATTITKTADGKLVYQNSGGNAGTMLYDTIVVPRGGQHQVKFADGSIAYLNADSKLRIPENFEGSGRTVELISGEADFHVVHHAERPFTVIANGQITKDIGTEFNINAYPDEPAIKTTLLEGSIRINKNKQFVILKPGQQSVVSAANSIIKVQEADTDEAFAWKNGQFIFNSAPLENIMRQVSRWYDVNVIYESESLKAKRFSAISTRFTNASQVLHDLELTGDVKFDIEGKTIKVLTR